MKVIRAIESAGGKVPSIKEYLKVRAFHNRIRSKCKEFKSHRKAFAKAGIRRSSMRSYTRHIIRGEYYNRIQVASYVIMAGGNQGFSFLLAHPISARQRASIASVFVLIPSDSQNLRALFGNTT